MADITLKVTFTIRDRFYTDDEKTVIDSVIRLADSNGWQVAIVTGPAESESIDRPQVLDLAQALRTIIADYDRKSSHESQRPVIDYARKVLENYAKA